MSSEQKTNPDRFELVICYGCGALAMWATWLVFDGHYNKCALAQAQGCWTPAKMRLEIDDNSRTIVVKVEET